LGLRAIAGITIMQQMTQGETKEPPVQRKVQLASRTELKNWADIGPRSVAAAAR